MPFSARASPDALLAARIERFGVAIPPFIAGRLRLPGSQLDRILRGHPRLDPPVRYPEQTPIARYALRGDLIDTSCDRLGHLVAAKQPVPETNLMLVRDTPLAQIRRAAATSDAALIRYRCSEFRFRSVGRARARRYRANRKPHNIVPIHDVFSVFRVTTRQTRLSWRREFRKTQRRGRGELKRSVDERETLVLSE